MKIDRLIFEEIQKSQDGGKVSDTLIKVLDNMLECAADEISNENKMQAREIILTKVLKINCSLILVDKDYCFPSPKTLLRYCVDEAVKNVSE